MIVDFEVPENAIREQAARDDVTHFSTGVAVRRGDKILVVRRVGHDHLGGKYELPGGGIDEGETFIEGAVRELLEETGLTVTEVVRMFDGFDYQTPRKPKVWQINFLVEVEPGEVTLDPDEHDDYRWIKPEDIEVLDVTANMKKCLHRAFSE